MTNMFAGDHWYYRLLYKVRPSALSSLIKRLLRVRRQAFEGPSSYRLYLDPVSHFGREILDTGSYEPVMSELYRKLLKEGETFIDVGANEGYFSVLAAKTVGNTGKVIAIEPQSRLQQVIRENFRLNGCTNIEVHHVALSEKVGTLMLNLASDLNTGGSSFFSRRRFWTQQEMVRTLPLDELIKGAGLKKVKAMKIDAEGAEFDILKGGQVSIRENIIQHIILEFHPHLVSKETPKEIHTWLKIRGYVLTQIGTGPWIYHLPGLEKDFEPFGEFKRIESFGD